MTDDPIVNQMCTILRSPTSFESKAEAILALDQEIADLYARGLTKVKPVHLVTPDDLV